MKALKSLFARPFGHLKKCLPELRQLKSQLENLHTNEPIENLIQLFNIVSPWHDRGLTDLKEKFSLKNDKEAQEVLAILNELELHIRNAGRDDYGMNRTNKGEGVCLDDVYLGDIYGLWTKKASYWLSLKNSEKKRDWGYPGMENMTSYEVISAHALRFIESHRPIMIQLINKLELTVQ